MEITLAILATSILIGGLAYVISKAIIKSRIAEYKKSCDYTLCKKYCEMESKLKIVMKDNRSILNNQTKYLTDISKELKK